jgi:hypothetical protein
MLATVDVTFKGNGEYYLEVTQYVIMNQLFDPMRIPLWLPLTWYSEMPKQDWKTKYGLECRFNSIINIRVLQYKSVLS